jgi:hypothetical protein
MRAVFQAAVFCTLTSLLTGTALARDTLTVDTDQPADFQAVQDDQQKIETYLAQTQCGGFNLQESVAGKIANVSGVPGSSGRWDTAPLSGMGVRNDDFALPDNAVGLTTACMSDKSEITKSVWRSTDNAARPGEITQSAITYPHPKFEDPSCRWRIKNPDNTFANQAPDIPLKATSDYSPPLNYDEMSQEPNDRQSPVTCASSCTYLNSWQFYDCLETGDATDATGTPYKICNRWGNKYLCTDAEVTNAANACNPSSSDNSNARVCVGSQCRCQADGGPNPGNNCVANPGTTPADAEAKTESPVYYSYYRSYKGNFTRDAVPSDGPADDTTRNGVGVSCYGFYDEFDPKNHQTQPKDRRCVINVDVSTMFDSQKGKGSYGQDTTMNDKDPIASDNQRTKKDTATDIWYMKLGWGFSLLDEKTFKNTYDQNLSNVYLDTDSLDRGQMTGSWPIDRSGENNPHWAVSDALRSFDDTGKPRIIVSWWQKQETEVSVLLHPAVVRLLMPPGYAFGADPSNPVFAQSSSSSSEMNLDTKRTKSIEVQIDATDDTLGEAFHAVEESFVLHVQEDPVPVLVPMGSPTEFRARAEEWCTWWIRKSGVPTCDDAPQDVKDLIQKLNEYADQIEQVRELRAELATYAGKVLTIQKSLTTPISDWINNNLQSYENYLETQQNFATDVATGWRAAEQKMTDFQDKTNLPWCMNQRFETPIYSLLDDWMPSRADGGKITADGLPNITAPRPQDLMIDFSGINYMTGSLSLPILKPVQVRLQIPSPPSIDDEAKIGDPLPDLPSISAIRTAIDDSMKKLPKVQTGATYPPLALPTMDDGQINAVKTTIQQITDTLGKMNDRYDKFWKSIGPLSTNTSDTSRNGIPVMKSKQECKGWDDDTCQHVEMDLMERFQRIGSRKLVMLKEDYASLGVKRRTPGLCQPMDQVCLLLHGERPNPAYIWQINPPKKIPDLGTLARSAVRDATLPDPVGGIDADKFPPYDTDVKNLLPFFDVPKPIDLTPPKS